jgi:hypothetical protein
VAVTPPGFLQLYELPGAHEHTARASPINNVLCFCKVMIWSSRHNFAMQIAWEELLRSRSFAHYRVTLEIESCQSKVGSQNLLTVGETTQNCRGI